jgi:YfiH family protein
MMSGGRPIFERRQAGNGAVFVGGDAFAGRIRYGFFSAEGGVSHGVYDSLNCGFGSDDKPGSVSRNREVCTAAMGLATDRLAAVFQTHSADAVTVTASTPANRETMTRADGMATTVPELGLAILTADCLPLLLGDADAGVIGACHAGWRGAATGIIQATLAEMQAAGAQQITALIGPTIRQASYQVGSEMRAEIMESKQDNRVRADNIAGCFMVDPERDDRYLFDLPGFVRAQLDAAGVAQIADCGEDTYTPSGTESPRFFSHRRATHEAAPDSGRQISIISLAATPG